MALLTYREGPSLIQSSSFGGLLHKILLVEDSQDSYNLIHKSFDSSIDLTWAQTYSEAIEIIQSERHFDLILLDVLLPDGDGFELAKEVKRQLSMRSTPVIFITSKNTISDIVVGFSIGADDYITKPFNVIELGARIEARLRKLETTEKKQSIRSLGALTINLESHLVFISKKGGAQQIDLTPIEFKILNYLMSKPGAVFTRDEILTAIWGEDIHIYSRSVDSHVSKLRRKLEFCSSMIRSIHGVGYKIIHE